MLEFILEGSVFLIMGLELEWVLDDVKRDHFGIARAVEYATIALLLTIAIRALYVVPLIYLFRAGARRASALSDAIQDRIVEPLSDHSLTRGIRGLDESSEAEKIERFRKTWRRRVADIDYFRKEQLGWREGTVIVWAGMRGAVTLAAAQTLPTDTPSRSLLVFVAFLVAAASLLIQGSTLPWLARKMLPPVNDLERTAIDRARLSVSLRNAGLNVLQRNGRDTAAPFPELVAGPMPPDAHESQAEMAEDKRIQLEMIQAQRNVLLAAMSDGSYSSELINAAMASQICDGASAVLIANERAVAAHGLRPLARIHTMAVCGSDPTIVLEGPIPATRLVLEVDNPELLLRPGMTASVKVRTAEAEDALHVPNAALRFTPPDHAEEPKRHTVWVLRDGEPVALRVVPGISDDVVTQIDDDGTLKPGDEVLVDLSPAGRKLHGKEKK